MNPISIKVENLDREELRIFIAALRDKRDQMRITQEKERNRAIEERRQVDTTVGELADRMGDVVESLRAAYKMFPDPKTTVEFAGQPAESESTALRDRVCTAIDAETAMLAIDLASVTAGSGPEQPRIEAEQTRLYQAVAALKRVRAAVCPLTLSVGQPTGTA